MLNFQDVQDFQQAVAKMINEIGDCVQTTRQRVDTLEVSLDSENGKHLALVEMVATRAYNHMDAPIKSVVIFAYRFIERHNQYSVRLHSEREIK